MNVQEYLQEQHVPFMMHEHPAAYTAQEVAAEEHISGKMLAKAVVVRTDKSHIMCVLPASCRLDLNKVAAVAKVKKARLADEMDMAKLFPDVEVGAEPPFGNLYQLPTFVDERLAADDEIVFQGGTHRLAVRMKFADYERCVNPIVADLAITV